MIAPSVSPDGKRIAVTSAGTAVGTAVTLRAASGEILDAALFSAGDPYAIGWSADGRVVHVQLDGDVFAVDVATHRNTLALHVDNDSVWPAQPGWLVLDGTSTTDLWASTAGDRAIAMPQPATDHAEAPAPVEPGPSNAWRLEHMTGCTSRSVPAGID